MPLVLLVTSSDWADGEPGAPALDSALADAGIEARWVCWDDPEVDWSAADLVAVRSPWDYMARHQEFVAWARRVEQVAPVLNSADVFAWNVDKAYLTRLGDVPVVPTLVAETVEELRAAVAETGRSVVKPRIGAGGAGVLVVEDPDDPRLGEDVEPEHPELDRATGPWVVQPLVESVRTEGETSVFVLDGEVVAQVDKVPAGSEIRVHEHFGGVVTPVPVRGEAADLARQAVAIAVERLGGPRLRAGGHAAARRRHARGERARGHRARALPRRAPRQRSAVHGPGPGPVGQPRLNSGNCLHSPTPSAKHELALLP